MANTSQALSEMKEEVRELRLLYKELIDRLVPVEKPTREEKKAIESDDEIVSERELKRTLGFHGRD